MSDEKKPELPLSRLHHDGVQLQQMKTPHTNSVLRGPEDTDVGDLVCELALDPHTESIVTVSAWELTDQQRAWLAAGAHMRMSVWQHPIPPLALAVEPPFCKACEEATIYVKSEQAFACPNTVCALYGNMIGSDDELVLKANGEAADQEDRAAEEQVRGDFSPAPDGSGD